MLILLCLLGCRSEPTGEVLPAATASETTPPPPASATPSTTVTAPAPPPDDWVESVLRSTSAEEMPTWLAQSEALRLQLLVTVVQREGAQEAPRFRLIEKHGYRVDADYLYPASAIKTFIAVAALRHLRAIAREQEIKIDQNTRFMRCKTAAGRCEVPEADEDEDEDDDEDEEKLRVGREVRKLLAYSDNDSYDRFYDLLGHRALNEAMGEMGFESVRFHHRLSTTAMRRTTRRVLILPWGARAIRHPPRVSDYVMPPTFAARLKVGQGYRDARGVQEEPMDFGAKNYASLYDLHRITIALVAPELTPGIDLGLAKEDLEVVLSPMTGRLHPGARGATHKPMLPGLHDVIDIKRLRYTNKAGRAYGFHMDSAYVEDEPSGKGFFVTAAVYANPNGILNDDDYAYEDLSGPFLAAVGEALAKKVFGDIAPPKK